jgi:hypothetical protein
MRASGQQAPVPQAEERPLVQVLPTTSASLTVAFYKTPEAQLAECHQIVLQLLAACRRPRNGCYTLPMAALVAETNKPPSQVPPPQKKTLCGSHKARRLPSANTDMPTMRARA